MDAFDEGDIENIHDNSHKKAKRPRLASASYEHPFVACNSDEQISTTINKYIEPTDEEILAWQEVQLSRSIVDNAVNRVVQTYMTYMTASENAENPSTPGLEESAILMAINEHGLQQNSATEANIRSTPPPPQIVPPLQLPPRPLSAPTYLEQTYETEQPSAKYVPTCNMNSTDKENRINEAGNGESVDTCSSSSENADLSTGVVESRDETNADHFNFMDAAVSVAIRIKGLTPYSIHTSTNR